MENNFNVVAWFEIPVNDIQRAMNFYKDVLGYDLQLNDMGDLQMAFFPYQSGAEGAAGSLIQQGDFYKPSQEGTLVYFSSPSGDLAIELEKVTSAGGKIVIPKRQISETAGYMGLFLDSEGNRIALHSPK